MHPHALYSKLDSLPTLSVGQADNLKYDNGTMRLWCSRVGPEDGYDGPPVVVEILEGGRWLAVDAEEGDWEPFVCSALDL